MIDIHGDGHPEKCPICGCPYSVVEYGKFVRFVCGSEWSLQSGQMAHRSSHCAIIARLTLERDTAREMCGKLAAAKAELSRLIRENETLREQVRINSEYLAVLECSNDELRQEAGYVQ
jgi:hypothetical protein